MKKGGRLKRFLKPEVMAVEPDDDNDDDDYYDDCDDEISTNERASNILERCGSLPISRQTIEQREQPASALQRNRSISLQ